MNQTRLLLLTAVALVAAAALSGCAVPAAVQDIPPAPAVSLAEPDPGTAETAGAPKAASEAATPQAPLPTPGGMPMMGPEGAAATGGAAGAEPPMSAAEKPAKKTATKRKTDTNSDDKPEKKAATTTKKPAAEKRTTKAPATAPKVDPEGAAGTGGVPSGPPAGGSEPPLSRSG